ncbi:probable MAD2 - spindle-assembly checkpoint protein [Melanopsichium pennsylvanicum]|uniref:Probable MAD2 - spindle-assembly checkpoint protein n=1 Tax=Melanopsichium pennsylvanicum TaxID=63383 RepID=A0AAJ5C6B9_9BASI|nr:probable MAD2 - spindle-assembly checkpoint protein [Melanopsichium pennsylvanicum]
MATAQAQANTRTHLTLKGSTALVHEFFTYSVQSILYQRNIYPSDDFKTVKKYGLQMLVTTDEGLAEYLETAMSQLKVWLEKGDVTRLVVAIIEKDSGETRERWQFDVHVLNNNNNNPSDHQEQNQNQKEKEKEKGKDDHSKKTDAQVKAEIAAIIKQITASCTFLPILDEPCAFQILAYTNKNAQAPKEWTDSDPRLIQQGQAEQVRLRSFSTHVHTVEGMVAYRREQDDD